MFKALDDYFSNLQGSKDSHQSAVEATPETSPESVIPELEVSKATLTVNVEFTKETKCDCEKVKIEPEIELKKEIPVKKRVLDNFRMLDFRISMSSLSTKVRELRYRIETTN